MEGNEITPQLMFDLELEDAEFKCNFNKLVETEDVDDDRLQGATEADDTNISRRWHASGDYRS